MSEPIWGARSAAHIGQPVNEELGPRRLTESGPIWGARAASNQQFPQVSWGTLTGQNLQGTANAFDTEFLRVARRQDEEQSSRGMRDRWTRPDATGVAVYDDPSQGVVFGDVYLNGQKQGNLLEGYQGFSREQGIEMMARFTPTMSRESWAKAYEAEAGVPGTGIKSLEAELERAREESTRQFDMGLDAMAFQGRVHERYEELSQSGWAQAANVAASAAAGTAWASGVAGVLALTGVGAAAAPFIIGIGAGLGALGGWLNRDSQLSKIAQAQEQWAMARDAGVAAVGLGDAIAGWGAAAAQTMNVTRNLFHGIYDGLGDSVRGDGESRYEAEGASAPLQALDTALMLVDGVGSFGSRAAVTAFTTSMAVTATGSTLAAGAGLAHGGQQFNPYAGRYEDIGIGGTLMRMGAAGIDIGQTAIGRGLMRVVGRPSGMAQYQGGYRIGVDAAGERAVERVAFSALIPSEIAVGLSARMLARRSVRRAGGEPTREVLARETARHIDNLVAGRRGLATMAVNAYGEGFEEVVQAFLEAGSVGVMPSWSELFESFRQGAAMGAGMGLAVHAGSRSRSRVNFDRANLQRSFRKEEELTWEQWQKLSVEDQAREARTGPEMQELADRIVEGAESRARVAAANTVEAERGVEALLAAERRVLEDSQPTPGRSYLSVMSNYEWAPQDGVLSLEAAFRLLSDQIEIWQPAAGGTPIRLQDGELVSVDEASREYARQVLEAVEALRDRVGQSRGRVRSLMAAQDAAGVRAEIDELNAVLRNWWADRSSPQAFGKRRAVSLLGVRYPVDSATSYQLLRLQVSPELTLRGEHNTLLAPMGIQDYIGGDFDGDRFSVLSRTMLGEDAYNRLRRGDWELTSTGVKLPILPYAKAAVELMGDRLQAAPGSKAYRLATQGLDHLATRVSDFLREAGVPREDRKALVGALRTGVRHRDIEGAVEVLFERLAQRHSEKMVALGERWDESPWHILHRRIEDSLRQYAASAARSDMYATSTLGQVDLPKPTQSIPRYPTRIVEGTSDMLTGAVQESITDYFRLTTFYKYNPLREPLKIDDEAVQAPMFALIDRFNRLSQGLVRLGADSQLESQMAQLRSLEWLGSLAREYQRADGLPTFNDALIEVATAQVPEVDLRTGTFTGKTISIAQMVLREVVHGLRREYGEIVARNDQLARRLQSLEELTQPDSQDGASRRASGGSALVELFGGRTLVDLLGQDAGGHLGNLTVRDLRERLVNMSFSARQEYEAALRSHPYYDQEVEGGVGGATPYRALIDSIIESARMEMHEKDGIAYGRRAQMNHRTSEAVLNLLSQVRGLARTRGTPLKTREDARAFVEANPTVARSLLQLTPHEEVVATLRSDETGTVPAAFPQWLYDVLAEPEAKVAEFMLWRNGLEVRKNLMTRGDDGLLDPDRASDRILRLMLELDYHASNVNDPNMPVWREKRDRFLRYLHESRSRESFEKKLNLDPQLRSENEAPHMIWASDMSHVEVDHFGQGLNPVPMDVSMSEAIQDAVRQSTQAVQDATLGTYFLEKHSALLQEIKKAKDRPDLTNGGEAWLRFKDFFESAIGLPNMISPRVHIEAAAYLGEVTADQGDKGKAPEHMVAEGEIVARQVTTYDSAPGRILASATSLSENALLGNLNQLTSSDRTVVMNDGTVVHVERITAERMLELLMDRETAGAAARAMGFTVWDVNPETGGTSLRSLFGGHVAEASQDPLDTLFIPGDAVGRARRMAIAEGRTMQPGGAPPLGIAIAHGMLAAETASQVKVDPARRRELAQRAADDLGDIFLMLTSKIDGADPMTEVDDPETGERTTLMNLALRNAGRRVRAETQSDIAHMLHKADEDTRAVIETMLTGLAAKLAARGATEGNTLLLASAKEVKEQVEAADKYTSPIRLLVDRFSKYTDPLVQQEIVTLLRSWGDVANSVPWARWAIERAVDPATPTVEVPVVQENGSQIMVTLPQMTQREWDSAARGLVAYLMHSTYSPATSSEHGIAELRSLTDEDVLALDLPMWDPSFVELVLQHVAPGVMENPLADPSQMLSEHLLMSRQMNPHEEGWTLREVEDRIYEAMRPLRTDPDTGATSGRFGQWHSLFPEQAEAATGAYVSASAPKGVSMAGINQERTRLFSASTPRTWDRQPPPDELSTATVSALQWTTSVVEKDTLDSQVDMMVAQRVGNNMKQVAEQGRLGHLDGRIYTELLLSGPRGERVDLLTDDRYEVGVPLPAEAGETSARYVSVETVSEAVAAALADMNIPTGQWKDFNITASFYHPKTKATSSTRDEGQQFSHSGWFDGGIGRTRAAFNQASLLSSQYFLPDGEIPRGYARALDAQKTMQAALQQVTTMPEAHRRQLLKLGLTDMFSMLDQMATFMTKQHVDGRAFPASHWNAFRKYVETLHVVRYVDEQGMARELSAEQVIALQQSEGWQGFPENSHAEVVGLPIEMMLAIMGEAYAGVPRQDLWGRKEIHVRLNEVEPLTRFRSETWTKWFPGFLATEKDEEGNVTGWKTADVMRHPRMHHQPPLPALSALPSLKTREGEQQDFFARYRPHQEQVLEQRRAVDHTLTRWARQQIEVNKQAKELVASLPLAEVMHYTQQIAEGDINGAVNYQQSNRETQSVSPTLDATTAWLYRHDGPRDSRVVTGTLVDPESVAQKTMLGDELLIAASTFFSKGRTEIRQVLPDVRDVLDAAARTGVTIRILPEPGQNRVLARHMEEYLRSREYSRESPGSPLWVPRPMEAKTLTEEMYSSRLRQQQIWTTRNRRLIVAGQHVQVHEHSIYPVNDGIGAQEFLYMRERVNTTRYMGYAPPSNREQEIALANALLPVLQTEEGINYLIDQSEAKAKSEQATLKRDLQSLRSRLESIRENPESQATAMPMVGQPFGTGTVIPLIEVAEGQTAEDGITITGIHLMRHGHEATTRAALRGPKSEANLALGVGGARLTVDKAAIDPDHTAYSGELYSPIETVGMQQSTWVQVDPSELGSRIIGPGIKWTTTPAPSDLFVPKGTYFGGQPVRGVSDMKMMEDKNADSQWLNSPLDITAWVGFTTEHHLVRALTGVEYDANAPAQYQEAAIEVRRLLTSFAEQYGGTVSAADAVRRHRIPEFQQAMVSQLEARLQELLEDAPFGVTVPTLAEDPTATNQADVTMLRLVLTAIATGAPVESVIGTPGALGVEGVTSVRTMSEVFTTLLEQLPPTHPAKQAYIAQINSRMAEHDDDRGDGYRLHTSGHQWIERVTTPNGIVEQRPVMLVMQDLHNTMTNGAVSEAGEARKTRSSVSPTTEAMLYTAVDLTSMIDERRIARTLERNFEFDEGALSKDQATALKRAFNLGVKAPVEKQQMTAATERTPAEQFHLQVRAKPARAALRVDIDDSAWYADMTKAEARLAKQRYEKAFTEVMELGRFKDSERLYVVEMIRSVQVRGVDREIGEQLTYAEAMSALKLIARNMKNRTWPLYNAGIPAMGRDVLQALRRNGYKMVTGDTNRGRDLETWTDWVDMMLGQVFSDDPVIRAEPAAFRAIDGLLAEYEVDVPGLAASAHQATQEVLNTIQTRNGMMVANPLLRRQFDHPIVEDGVALNFLDELEGSDAAVGELSTSARSHLNKRMDAWINDSPLLRRQERQTLRTSAKRGAQIRQATENTQVLVRIIKSGFIIKTMLNPGIWISSFIEQAVHGLREGMVNLFSGEALWMRPFSKEQKEQWRNAEDAIMSDARFYEKLYGSMDWSVFGAAAGRVEARLQKIATWSSASVSDPMYGRNQRAVARQFLSAAWDALQMSGTEVPVEQFLDIAVSNPANLAALHPDAVELGLNRIYISRNLQDNLVVRGWNSLLGKANANAGPGTSALLELFGRLPTMFLRFRSNTLINLLGLQGVHATLATLLSNRTRREGGMLDRLLGRGDLQFGLSDEAMIEDSLDLTRAFLRSGASHTQLFLAASLIRSLGFTGDDEDEEERRRRKLERFQFVPVAKDPLALENDFRNANAWFIDMLPAGIGVPSWIVRMFTSPVMGMARFFDTGDFRQVVWGFQDALGSMPLLNLDTALKTFELANELVAAAEAEALEDNLDANMNALRLATMAIGTMENLLFESAFLSMLYQGGDKWDRDPFAVVDRDETGRIRRDTVHNTPLRSRALVERQDGSGEKGYVSHSRPDAMLRTLAEQRPVLAFTMALIHRDSTFIRTNMVPKERNIRSEELDMDEAQDLIMSIVDNELGRETLTADGAEAVVRGIHLGTVRMDSPTLNGVYIPRDMKQELEVRFLEDLTNKYLNMGMSDRDALSHAKEEYYGQGFGEEDGLGYADILWGDYIPEHPTHRYRQLNTTYVMGPLGRPVATGVQRSWMQALGLVPFDTYHAGEQSSLPVDELLNSRDMNRGMNLGMRALEKIDESHVPLSDEDIHKQVMKALEDIGGRIDKLRDPTGGPMDFNGWGGWRNYIRGARGFRSTGGGGGYSGASGYSLLARYGGQAQRLNAPRRVRSAAIGDLYTINKVRPIIRRADLRRERFSSQRGRLKQWQ